MLWAQAVVAESETAAESDVVCEAAIFFANRSATAGAVGCPCKSCVKTVGVLPTGEPQPQLWRCQRPEQRSSNFETCSPPVYGKRLSSPSGQLATPMTGASPDSHGTSSHAEQTLQMLLDRAKHGASRAAAAGFTAAVPAQTLRRTAPGGLIRPVYQHFQAQPLYRRRTECRSTSPIPVPSPPSRSSTRSQHWRSAAAPAALSVDGALRRGDDDSADKEGFSGDDVVDGASDAQDNGILLSIMRLYERVRKERSKRAPGRPSEPRCVVIGFEP